MMLPAAAVAALLATAHQQVHITRVYFAFPNGSPVVGAKADVKRVAPTRHARFARLRPMSRPGWYSTNELPADTTRINWSLEAPSFNPSFEPLSDGDKNVPYNPVMRFTIERDNADAELIIPQQQFADPLILCGTYNNQCCCCQCCDPCSSCPAPCEFPSWPPIPSSFGQAAYPKPSQKARALVPQAASLTRSEHRIGRGTRLFNSKCPLRMPTPVEEASPSQGAHVQEAPLANYVSQFQSHSVQSPERIRVPFGDEPRARPLSVAIEDRNK